MSNRCEHSPSHVVVGLADCYGSSQWHTVAGYDSPQDCAVDGVLCFGHVGEAHF